MLKKRQNSIENNYFILLFLINNFQIILVFIYFVFFL